MFADRLKSLSSRIDLLEQEEKKLSDQLEIVSKKRKSEGNVQDVVPNKLCRINDEAYIQSFDYSDRDASLIPTAMVKIELNGLVHGPFRAMLDTGAHLNLVVDKLRKELKIPTKPASGKLIGINGTPFTIKRKAMVKILPWYASSSLEPYICEPFWFMPEESQWQPILPSNLVKVDRNLNSVPFRYADPNYFKPGPVYLLLGVSFFAKSIISVFSREPNGTVLLETFLGMVVLGPNTENFNETNNACSAIEYSKDDQLDQLLSRLWEIDQVGSCSIRTEEEEFVEQHFIKTHYRDKDGVFVVKMPLKEGFKEIGSSREVALRRFMYLERKLGKNVQMKDNYIAKMRESIRLGHAQLADSNPSTDGLVYYIPHHCIEKKFRIVYDASCRTDKGVSLNDIQMLGEKLQRDLHDIVMRFRRHRIAVCGDIKKMFNQVRLSKEQWNLQRIFWRENKLEPLREYWLTVVTFGLTSSAHLAVRSVVQAAREAQEEFPEAANAIENDYYMDDCTTGESNESRAIKLAKDMYRVLKGAGFELCQWKSNSTKFMKEMNAGIGEASMVFSGEEKSSILGLKWLISSDQFTYEVKTPKLHGTLTKRKIVSCIAQLYDPNGYISPVTIIGKIMIQDIWRLSIGWDDRIPVEIENRWKEFWNEIILLERFRIDRWLGTLGESTVQLHGFSDASSTAYGAVIYIRTEQLDGTVGCRLLVSKTRVAPLKTVTIPRLELAAAELLSRLLVKVTNSMEWQSASYFLWSDSTVVLHWIRKLPCSLKTYVANRVSSIQTNTEVRCWHYVNTKDNPADLLSRGIQPSALIDNKLWLEGPMWLRLPQTEWPKKSPVENTSAQVQSEMKVFVVTSLKPMLCISAKHSTYKTSLLEYTNRLEKLINIVSYMIRFIDNWSVSPTFKIRTRRVSQKIGQPTLDEKARAMAYLLRKSQEEDYSREIASLKNHTELPEKSKLEPLKPILDVKGLLRVGGRLDRSSNSYEMNHPAIVPNGSRLAWLIIDHAHRTTKHGAVQVMMQFVRQKYWIPKLRNELRYYLHKCVICARYNYKLEHQLMSELPADRVQIGKPFLHSGVDYAGPLEMKIINRQGDQITKAKCWVAIFVCFKTRAVHIDLVTDLTSVAFIACYERFIARRGRCERMYSDNGTSFVGTSNELKRAIEKWTDKEAITHLNCKGTEWRFMIPAAPHQGGIYEAAVKSMKYHLKRIVGLKVLPYEQLSTLLVQIEAILNSRPIHPLSDDPSDVQALTPGHFLVGEPTILPIPFDVSQQPSTVGVRLWKDRQRMLNHFWERWSTEYLTTLQQRKKWRRDKEQLKIGQLVTIANEGFPPAHWALGRICELIVSKDGLVRSVVVQTETGKLKRPVQKICIIPVGTAKL